MNIITDICKFIDDFKFKIDIFINAFKCILFVPLLKENCKLLQEILQLLVYKLWVYFL